MSKVPLSLILIEYYLNSSRRHIYKQIPYWTFWARTWPHCINICFMRNPHWLIFLLLHIYAVHGNYRVISLPSVIQVTTSKVCIFIFQSKLWYLIDHEVNWNKNKWKRMCLKLDKVTFFVWKRHENFNKSTVRCLWKW